MSRFAPDRQGRGSPLGRYLCVEVADAVFPQDGTQVREARAVDATVKTDGARGALSLRAS